jgi:hypothetical protein
MPKIKAVLGRTSDHFSIFKLENISAILVQLILFDSVAIEFFDNY